MDDIKTKNIIKIASDFSVLYVEDEDSLREKIFKFLSRFFKSVDAAKNGLEGFEKYSNNQYDIVITDILMPKMNGIELISKIREVNRGQEVIVISAYTDSSYLVDSIKLGVTGYIIKPIQFDQIIDVLEQSLSKLLAFRENEMYKNKLEMMVEDRTKKVLLLKSKIIQNHEDVIHSLVKMIEARDSYTGGHSERVASYSRDIATAMEFSKEECNLIYQAGILHDIGKIVTPDAILLKPGMLNNNEYSLIQDHVVAGYEILSRIPMYKNIAEIMYAHHEKYDGSGYPRAIKGDAIPVFSRIMMVADSFDAMTTSRIYKARKSVPEAIEELKKLKSTFYDPNVVDVAVNVLKEVKLDDHITQNPISNIDYERFAYFYKDLLTHAYNHSYLDLVLNKRKDENQFICLNMIYIRNFASYNEKNGWSSGDRFLSDFATYLESEFPDSKIFRIFGYNFVVLNDEHKDLDINKINAISMLKENNLYCEYKYYDLDKTNIDSYLDLVYGVL